MAGDLHTKYRPKTLDDVIGHDDHIYSLATVIDEGKSHAFLFMGPAGVGKTTLARIAATDLKCKEVIEIDAATHTGIDAMREVTSTLAYRAFGGGNKAVIVDECHRLSQAAWASLLKILEEPPAHVYWMLCTTETGKVPKTIKTRCVEYNLKPLPRDRIFELLKNVAKAEDIGLDDDSLKLIARHAEGSVRQALVSLSLCSSAEDKAEVGRLLQKADESDELLELCRLLANPQGRTWKKAMALVSKLEVDAESARIVILQYLKKAAMGADKDERVCAALQTMEPFSKPFNPMNKEADLLLAIGEVIYGQERTD